MSLHGAQPISLARYVGPAAASLLRRSTRGLAPRPRRRPRRRRPRPLPPRARPYRRDSPQPGPYACVRDAATRAVASASAALATRWVNRRLSRRGRTCALGDDSSLVLPPSPQNRSTEPHAGRRLRGRATPRRRCTSACDGERPERVRMCLRARARRPSAGRSRRRWQ
jgi:hypothetical protein